MYSVITTTRNPIAIVIMIDRSGSMMQRTVFNGKELSCAQVVSWITNILLSEIVNLSKRDDGIRHYFDVSVIGYGGDYAEFLLPKEFMSPKDLNDNVDSLQSDIVERVLPDGSRVMTTIEHNCWLGSKAEGNTPMLDAFKKSYSLLKRWCKDNPHSFPPLLYNITDGEATDGSHQMIRDIATKLKSLKTNDGELLLTNIHISAGSDSSVIFPSSKEVFNADPLAELLYDISSDVPDVYAPAIHSLGLQGGSFRSMGYNSSVNQLLTMLNIGTVSVTIP